jgi:hypothetical protein
MGEIDMTDLILSAICIGCIIVTLKEIGRMLNDDVDLDEKEYCPGLDEEE